MLLHLRLYYIQDRLLHLGVLQALSIRGVTFQEECRFTTHVRNKLIEANKCLFILRSLIRREDYIYSGRYNQTICFKVVIPDLTYGLSVYTVLCRAQCFLYQCHKRRYICKAFNIHDLLEIQDRKIFDKVLKHEEKHSLRNRKPKLKAREYNLRHKSSHRPKINKGRSDYSFINRLIFKYNLAL